MTKIVRKYITKIIGIKDMEEFSNNPIHNKPVLYVRKVSMDIGIVHL